MTDPNTIRRIVAAADLAPADTVLEIGPGLGSLTLGLADAVRRVVAVEIDAGLVTALREVVAGRDDVEVVHADALRVRPGELVGPDPVRVVANLPYRTATALLFHLLDDPVVLDAFVMVQREVGERWQATVGDPAYGGVSLRLALVADARITHAVPRAVFHPVPNVDSVLVRIRRRADAPAGQTLERARWLADVLFRQRRKTVRNALRAALDAGRADALLAAADVDPARRPETLDRDDLLRLAAALPTVRP